jgi:hypothetical protein
MRKERRVGRRREGWKGRLKRVVRTLIYLLPLMPVVGIHYAKEFN